MGYREEIEAGQAIVVGELARHSAELGIVIRSLDWYHAPKAARPFTLAMVTGTGRHLFEFSEEVLADAPATPGYEGILSRQMLKWLRATLREAVTN